MMFLIYKDQPVQHMARDNFNLMSFVVFTFYLSFKTRLVTRAILRVEPIVLKHKKMLSVVNIKNLRLGS